MRMHGITPKPLIILDKKRIEGVAVGGFYPPPPTGKLGNYPFALHGTIHLIIHVRNTHVAFSSGLHFSDIIYNVGAFAIYQHLNLWVPCVVCNSNSKNIFFEIAPLHTQRIVLYKSIKKKS